MSFLVAHLEKIGNTVTLEKIMAGNSAPRNHFLAKSVRHFGRKAGWIVACLVRSAAF